LVTTDPQEGGSREFDKSQHHLWCIIGRGDENRQRVASRAFQDLRATSGTEIGVGAGLFRPPFTRSYLPPFLLMLVLDSCKFRIGGAHHAEQIPAFPTRMQSGERRADLVLCASA
jgi:hypothetical protein